MREKWPEIVRQFIQKKLLIFYSLLDTKGSFTRVWSAANGLTAIPFPNSNQKRNAVSCLAAD